MTGPLLLFADEPTGNLDFRPASASSMRCGGRASTAGQTIVLVTHDAKAAAYADRVLVIGDGVDPRRDRARVAATITRPLR